MSASFQVESQPAAQLLPGVYDTLRRLAKAYSRKMPPGHTLQPTALVHEAFLRLVGENDPGWQGHRHFFGAAANAMRNILVERARRKGTRKHGAGMRRVELTNGIAIVEPIPSNLLDVDDAIQKLQAEKPHLAEIAMLRFYAGLSVDEAAAVLNISASTLAREWRFARAWLTRQLEDSPPSSGHVR